MPTDKEKSADEIFCRSCGETIKKEAEICPHCGVRNKKTKSGSRGRGTPSSTSHDPSNYETSVSETWWYGVAGGTIAWILILLLAQAGGDTGAFVGFLTLGAWIGLPIAGYFDMEYVRANSDWNPNTVVWVILLLVWIVNIIAGVVYLYRRHEVIGEP